VIQFIVNLPIEYQIAYGVLFFAVFIQSLYYLLVYLRPTRWKRSETNDTADSVSVIICAQNEFANLKNHLPKVLEQDYSNFEVIVVNDCSVDDTEMLLGELEQQYKHLRHTTIEQDRKFSHGKKLAVTIGMKSAKYNCLVFIDADCYPVSDQWLNEISKSYITDKQIVLGYGGYENRRGFLNKIIRFDTLFIAMQYLGSAMVGRPYMGVGRNLSYLKQLFFAGRGFAKHYQLLSGDDDLFINENANRDNTAVLLSDNSITLSKPQTKWANWAKQKKRHLTTGKYYKKRDKLFIGAELFTRFLFYISLVVLICLKADVIVISVVYSFRIVMQIIVFKLNMNKMNEKGFLMLVPLFDILLPIFHFIFILSNRINSRNNKWK
jgi:glycosyltransferase involved in cell wall biosynthesis